MAKMGTIFVQSHQWVKIKEGCTKVTRNLEPVTRDYWLFKLMIMGMSGVVKGGIKAFCGSLANVMTCNSDWLCAMR